MSGYAMEWAIEVGESKGLSPDARTVLVAVAYFANHNHGLAWCARDELMAKTSFGHNRVKRAVAELEAAEVVPMKRYPNRIVWGPFPVYDPKPKLSTPRSATGPPGVRSGPRKVARIVAACEAYRATGGPVTGPPGVREPLPIDTTPRDDCQRCGGVGVLLGDEIPNGNGLRHRVPCSCRDVAL